MYFQNNPFQDRIFRVFSSKEDDCFSFEDMVDLCSAFSAACPAEVKAAWAFRIFGRYYMVLGLELLQFMFQNLKE